MDQSLFCNFSIFRGFVLVFNDYNATAELLFSPYLISFGSLSFLPQSVYTQPVKGANGCFCQPLEQYVSSPNVGPLAFPWVAAKEIKMD